MIRKLNSYFLATAPIFSIYLLGNDFPLIYIIVSLLVIINICTIKFNKIFREKRNEIQWYLSIIIIGLFGFLFNVNQGYFDIGLFINNFLALSLFFIALILFTSNVDIRTLKRALIFLGLLAAIICLFQRAQLLITGSFYKELFLPGLEVKRDLDTFSTTRVSAFFTEPAHLSIFLLPIFYLALRNKKIILSIVLGLGVLFSGSTTGLLILTIMTLYYIIWVIKKIIYVIPILVIIVGLFIGILILFPDVLIENLEKLGSTDSDNIRLLGAFQYLRLFDFTQWLFGVGLNQFAGFLGSRGIHLMTDWGTEINANYSNAILYMLISYGILGFIAFLRYLSKIMNRKKCDLGFSIFALGILFSDQVLFNMNLLYIIMFIILSNKLIELRVVTIKSQRSRYRKLIKSNDLAQ